MEITSLAPALVWKNFHALTQIPRPSGHIKAVADYLVDFGKSHGCEAFIDKAGNVVMRKGATPGYENLETAILQAHMDMVPQAVKGSTHNYVVYVIALKNPVEKIQGSLRDGCPQIGDFIKALDTDKDGNTGNILGAGKISGLFKD